MTNVKIDNLTDEIMNGLKEYADVYKRQDI